MSPNPNYLKGRRLEYESMARWRAQGWTCARSAGSHGVWDLCAVKPNRPVKLIQCKAVSDEAAAKRLVADFIRNPPIPASECYHLVLEVKIKGSSNVMSVIV